MKRIDSILINISQQSVCIIQTNTTQMENGDVFKRFYGEKLFAHIDVDLEKNTFSCRYIEKFLGDIPDEGRFSDLAGILARHIVYPDDQERFYYVLNKEYLNSQFGEKRKENKNKSYYLDFRSMQAGEIKRCRMILAGMKMEKGRRLLHVHLLLQNMDEKEADKQKSCEKEADRQKSRGKEAGSLKSSGQTRQETVMLSDFREEKDGAEELRKMDFSGKRILLAEDNNMNRKILAEILRATGADVEEAENGREVLEDIRHFPEEYFDIIFMDISMPYMNGYDTARAVRKLEEQEETRTPIIAMTANVFAEDILAAGKAGMDGYITKPIDLKELGSVMEKWLKKESVVR